MNAAENRALSAEQQVKDMQTEMKAAENRALSAEQQVKDLQKEMASNEKKVLQAEEISTLITTETEVREESAQQILTTDVKVLKMEKMQHVQLVSKR